MTSWNLQPWQLKASCKTMNAADSGVTTNGSSSYYHLNINYNPAEEIVQLNFVPPSNQDEKEIKDKTEDKKINKYFVKANNICNADIFKQISILNDTSNKSIQVPSPSLKKNEKDRKHRRKKKSLSSVDQQLVVTDSVNTNTVCESNDVIKQKDLKSKENTNTGKLDKKKKHKHRRERSQETLTITDTFSIDHSKDQAKLLKNKTKKHRHHSERSRTATESQNLSRENCKDQTAISKDDSKKHKKRRECSEETLTITGTFSKTNFKDQIKSTKAKTSNNKKEVKEICTKHKKKSKKKNDKVATDTKQEELQDIIANFEKVSGSNTPIYYIHAAPENPLALSSALRTKSKDSLIKHAAHKSKRKRKHHLSLETKCKDIQNTTSSSSGKCKSRESCGSGKETLPLESKKEGIRFVFIRNSKNIKPDPIKNKTCKESKKGSEGIEQKHVTKGKKHSGNTDLVDAENSRNLKFKAKKVIDIPQNEVSISSKTKNRSQSADAKTFKKHVGRDSVETLHCVGDTGAKFNKKSKIICCSSQDKSDNKLETRHSYSKRQSKSETNIKHTEIDSVLKKTKEELVYDQKRRTSKKAKDKEKNHKRYPNVETGTSDAGVQKNNLKVEGDTGINKIFFKRNKHKNKDKNTDVVTEPRSLKKSNDSTINEEIKDELENKAKPQDHKENINATHSTDVRDRRECEETRENCRKRKRSKRETETVHSVDRKASKHKVIEFTGTVDVLDKNHKKPRKLEKKHHHYTTEEVTPKSSEEIQKKVVPDSVTKSKEVHRKSRKTKEAGISSLKDNATKHLLKFTDNTSKSTLPTEQDRSASVTDNSVVVYQLTAENEMNFVTEDKQFVNVETRRSKSESKKIIKISKEQLEAIINQINKKHNLQQSKTLHYKLPSNEEKPTELKEMRKEVSFSHLNLKPVAAYYACPTANLNSTYNSALSFPSKDKKQAKPKRKTKIPDQKSVVSEAITKKEKCQYVCGRRYSINRAARNFAYPENIFERSRKALRANESSTVGFTVEGVEPPKMLKPNIVPSCLIKHHSIPKELRVAVVSVIDIQPNYEKGMGCTANHNLMTGGKELRRSLSLLNATADRDFTEGGGLSVVSEKQQSSQSIPHAQTFTSLVSILSRGESRKSSTSRKSSLSPVELKTQQDNINLHVKTVTNYSRKLKEQELCEERSVEEINSLSSKCYTQGNRNFFEEDELDKEQLAALGQEVFNRMKEYLKDRSKISKEENQSNTREVQPSRKSVTKESSAVPDQTARSRIKKYVQDLNEKRRKLSRGSSASSRKSVISAKDTSAEKKDKKTTAITDENTTRRSVSRNSSNHSVSPRCTSPKIHLKSSARDRSSSVSKRKDSASRKENSIEVKNEETKSCKMDDKTAKVTTASRENSLESRNSRSPRRPTNTPSSDPLSSSKTKRLDSAKAGSTDRNRTESKDSIATNNNVTTTSRDTSNESIISKSNSIKTHGTHISLYDRATMQSKRKSSLSRKEAESKHLVVAIHDENEKATKIPRRISKEADRKSPNNRLPSDKEDSLERKENYSNRNIRAENNKKQRTRSPGSTSSEVSSTTKNDENRSSRLQATKNVKNLKPKASDVNKLKSTGTLQKSETFLCDSLSGEFERELKATEIVVPSVEENVTSDDATPLAKITEETSSQNSLDVTYSHLPEKLRKKEKRPYKSLKQVKHSQSTSPKHESTQERKVVDKKYKEALDEHLKYLSQEMFDKIVGMLNKKGTYHLGDTPIPNFSSAQKIESLQNLQCSESAQPKCLSEGNILQKDILNIKPYYSEEVQKSENENKTDTDQLIVINFSKQTKKPSKANKAKVKQDGAPEIICSSCSIKAHRDAFHSDGESEVGRNVGNKSSCLSFEEQLKKDPNDALKKTARKTNQFSDNSLENNPAAKCKLSSCLPIGKSKIPLRKEGECVKSINKQAGCEKPVEKKEENEKSRPDEKAKSIKIREKRDSSAKREEDIEKPIQKKEERDRSIQKKHDVPPANEKIQAKEKYNKRKDNSVKCNSTECLKMLEDYITAKEADIEYVQISKVDNVQVSKVDNVQVPSKVDNITGKDIIKQKLNIGSVKRAEEDADDKEVQRLSNLVKQNVMKELQAAHLLKPKALEGKSKKVKQLDGIIERSIASALNQKVYSLMQVDERIFKMENTSKTALSGDAQQLIDTQSWIQDDIFLQEPTEVTEIDQGEAEISYNKIPETLMKSNLQLAQEHKTSASENIRKYEDKHATYSQNAVSRKSNPNFNCKNNSDKQHKIEDKKEAVLEKLTALMSTEPDFLHLESRLDKLLGFRRERKTANNAEINGDNFENFETMDIASNPTVMHVQSVKNPFKKANQVAYTVPAKRCKVKKSRLKVNSSHEMITKRRNTDTNLSNTSKTHTFSKQSTSEGNAFALTSTSENFKKETKSSSNARSPNISKIPTLIKPSSSAAAKRVSKFTTSDTSETYSSKTKYKNSTVKSFDTVKEAAEETARVQSTADLEEPNSARFLTKLLDIELVEHPDNQSSSKLLNTVSKAKTSPCLNTKSGRPLSAYEKRKLYGESLRLKKIYSKNEPTLTSSNEAEKGANADCIFCYPQDDGVVSTVPELQKPTKKEASPSRPVLSKFASSYDETSIVKHSEVMLSPSESDDAMEDPQDSDADLQTLGCFLCTKMHCKPKESMSDADDDDLKTLPIPSKNKRPNKYPTAPALTKPTSSSRNLKQNFQRKSAPDERAKWQEKEDHIYQAYSVVADHPNVTDVFRNKFKTESSVSLFSRESMFSCDNISPCVSPRSFASNCSLNTFRSKTLCNAKSSSLLNANYSDELRNPFEEAKRLNSYRRIVRGPRQRKKNYTGKNTFNMALCSPSKEFFSTIEQSAKDNFTERKNICTNSPLNVTASYEFCHSTPEYRRREVGNIESAEDRIPFYSKSAGICRRKVSLLEACQHLRNNNSLSDHLCNEYVRTHVHDKREDANMPSNSSNQNKFYKKNKEVTLVKSPQRNKYKNVNRKTFFKDTKSLIYQSLERTSRTLGSSSRKSNSFPFSNLLNQQRRENMITDSNHSECDLTMPYVQLNPEHGQNSYNNNKNKPNKANASQNMAARIRRAATVDVVKTRDNRDQNRNVKIYSLRDLNYDTNSNAQHRTKSPILKRRRYHKYSVIDDGEPPAPMKISSSTRSSDEFFSKHNKRCSEDKENRLSSTKDEEGSYTIFKMDNDFQIHRKRKQSLDENPSEECFKIFAYNNIIELDMEYPPVYSTGRNDDYTNKTKSRLFPQTHEYKKERLRRHKQGDKFRSTPVTPTSEKTESGYGSSKSKKSGSLRKFFPQEQNVLDTFTSTFRCFDQEVFVGKSNPLSRVTTFPVNTGTYSKTGSRSQSDSCPSEYESQPNNSQRQRRKLLKGSTPSSDCSDTPNDPYKYNQPSSSKYKNICSNKNDRPLSYLHNIGTERNDRYCAKQDRLDINNQNQTSRTSRYKQRDSVKFEVDMGQPCSSNEDRKPLMSKCYSNQRHEQSKITNDEKINFSNEQYKSRIPQKLKPRAGQFRNEPKKLEEQFPSACDKHKSLLFLRHKLSNSYGRKENSSNRLNVDEEQTSYSNYSPRTPIKQNPYATYEYKEPAECNVLKYASLQRQRGNVCQIDSNESVEEARGRHKGLCGKQSDLWQSDSKEPVRRTGGRFRELIRSISRPFHTSRKLDEDGLAADERSSSYTASTEDSDSNKKYFWFKNYKNRDVNTDVTPKSSDTSLRDIAVGKSETRAKTPNINCLQKQVDQCHEYANKVCAASRLRKQGHFKQFADFKEIPLSILLGKNNPKPKPSLQTNCSQRSNRSKKMQPKLKVLDDANPSKEVLELKSLCGNGQDKISKTKFSNKFKKIYFHDESIENLDVKSKPFNKSGVYTEETCKTLRNLLENSECTKDTCKGLRQFLRKSECTKETYNDLRNALNESDCTEETCKNLRKLLRELRETFLEGTEGTNVNLKNISKESIIPLKELLDMGFQKLLDVPSECEPSNELSTELMRIPSDTSSRMSSHHTMKELLDLPYQESTQATSKTLSEDSIVPLRELLDKVFDGLLSTASKNSSASQFIESPFEEPSHVSLEKTSEFSTSEATVASTFTESLNMPVIKLAKSPAKTSLKKPPQPSAMESANITNKNQKRLSAELLKGLSQQTTEKLFESFKERLDTPLKEVHVNVLKSSPKTLLNESLTELYPGYTQPTFTNLRNLSKESKELLQVTLQKVLSCSKESLKMLSKEIDTLPSEMSLKDSSNHLIREQLQFSPSTCKAMTPNDLRKLTNKSLGAALNEAQIPKSPGPTFLTNSDNEPHPYSATTSKGLRCLSKESKEILEDIFQKLLTLSKESVGAPLKKIIALPAEVSLANPGKKFSRISELSPSEFSAASSNRARFSEEFRKMPPREAFLHISKPPTESETSLNTVTKEHSPNSLKSCDESLRSLCTESNETFEEQSKQESESELLRNSSSSTEMLLRELLQYYVEAPQNPPFLQCTKCATTQNKNKEPERSSNEVSSEAATSPTETLLKIPTKESLPSAPIEGIEQETPLKESLEHLLKESPQHSLACACKYLRGILKEPLCTAPKEAIIQILKSLAENLSKESKADLYPNIQNLFKGTELEETKSPIEVSLKEFSKSLLIEPSQCSESLYNYLEKGPEEPLDLSIKETSIKISKSPESVAAQSETVSKEPSEHSAEKPFRGCTKATCKKLKKGSKQSVDAQVKDVSVQVPKSQSGASLKESIKESTPSSSQNISKGIKEPLTSPPLGCTKATCKVLSKVQKMPVEVAQKDTSSTSLKDTSSSPETSKEMLEEVFLKLINLSEEAVSSKEMLEGVLSLSEEIGVSKEALLKGCTKTTCKNLTRSSKDATSEVPPLQCTKSTCTNLQKIPKESVDPSTKEASVQVVKSQSIISLQGSATNVLPNSSETTSKNLRSLSRQSKELLEEVFQKLSTTPSKEALEETFVKLISISKEMIASEEEVPINETTQSSIEALAKLPRSECTNSTCKFRSKTSKATGTLPSKEVSVQALESSTTIKESIKDTSDTTSTHVESLHTNSKGLLEEILSEHSVATLPKLPRPECTNSTCKFRSKISKATGRLPSKEVSVQAVKSPPTISLKESVKDVSNASSTNLGSLSTKSKEILEEISLRKLSEHSVETPELPLSGCTNSTCKFRSKKSEPAGRSPSKEVSVQAVEPPSIKESVQDLSDIPSANLESLPNTSKELLDEASMNKISEHSAETPKLPLSGCTNSTCKFRSKTSEATARLPSKEVSVQAVEPPSTPSIQASIKDISDTTSTNLESLPETPKEEISLKQLSEHSVATPQLPLSGCTNSTCIFRSKPSEATGKLPSKEVSVQAVESPSTTSIKDVSDTTSTHLESLHKNSKEILEEISLKKLSVEAPSKLPLAGCTNATCKYVREVSTSSGDLPENSKPMSEEIPLKEVSEYSAVTPPKEEFAKCTHDTCEYLRNLSKESRLLLEDTLQNLIIASRKSSKKSLSVLPEEPPQLAESLLENVSHKSSHNAAKESVELSPSKCACENLLPKSTENMSSEKSSSVLPEESSQITDSLLENISHKSSDDAAKESVELLPAKCACENLLPKSSENTSSKKSLPEEPPQLSESFLEKVSYKSSDVADKESVELSPSKCTCGHLLLKSTENVIQITSDAYLSAHSKEPSQIMKELPEPSTETPEITSKEPITICACSELINLSASASSKSLSVQSKKLSEEPSQETVKESLQTVYSDCICTLPEEPKKVSEATPENSNVVPELSIQSNEPSKSIEHLSEITPTCACKNVKNTSEELSVNASSVSSKDDSQVKEPSLEMALVEPEPSLYSEDKEPVPCICKNQAHSQSKQTLNVQPEQPTQPQKLETPLTCTCANLTSLSDESKERQEITSQNSEQSSNIPSEGPLDLEEALVEVTSVEPLPKTAKGSLQCACEETAPKVTSENVSKESLKSTLQNSESPQLMADKSEMETCFCENLISFAEESRELVQISLQDSTVSEDPSQLTKSVSQDPAKQSVLNNPTPGCSCKDDEKLSQQSVELSNIVFQNLVNSSEQCMNVQINERPHIMESLSDTRPKGQYDDFTKQSLEFSKYFFQNLAGLPKQSREFSVAFQNVLKTAKEPMNMLTKETPAKLNSLNSKMCPAECNESPGVSTSSEVPEELLKEMCNVSLKTMMELYDKVSDNKEMKTTFKAMVEELCKNKLKEEKLSDIATQSQLNIVHLLQNYREAAQTDCECSQNKEKTTKEEKQGIKSTTPPTKEEKGKYSSSQTKKGKQSVPAVVETERANQPIVKKDKIADSQESNISADNASANDNISIASKAEGGASMKSNKSFIDLEFSKGFGKAEDTASITKTNPLKELRDSLTDKELFEKLLDSYEKEENIVTRLSNDDEFFQSQLESVNSKESAETILKNTRKITKISEEKLLTALDLGSLSELTKDEDKKKYSIPMAVLKTAESAEVTQKRPSKSKISGFTSRVARLFKSDAVKEIVAPRADGYKNSVDVSYLGRSSESYMDMDEEPGQIQKSASNDDVSLTEDNQKVTFIGGQRFQEEKKLLGEDKKSKRRKSEDSDSNIVKPTELGKCFLRGFRSDYVSLGGDTCLLISNQEKEHVLRQQGLRGESYIEFSERDTPLEYLLALGFSIDEASNAIKDEDVKNRLFAAITEARIWINQISTVQGTLLYLIAYKAKPRIMRYYLQLVEAIINRRIQNAVKLDAFLRVLEKVEDGDLTMVNIIGSDKFDDEENEEKIVKKQLRQLFINVYKTAETEASLKNKPLSKNAIILLRILAAKYRAGLHPHLELIARYIGQGLLRNEVQLEAAMIYLSRLDTADVDLKEFEQYCGIVCKEGNTPASSIKAS